MPKKAATLEQLKADYIAECEAALMFHQRAQEAQRQVSQMREMHRQLKRDKGQKDNAAALEASIRAAEADANALEAQRVRASATAETLKVEMWAAVRQIGMAGEVR